MSPTGSLRFTPDTLLHRRDDRHLTNPVGHETILLDLETGDYLGLNRVAATIWRLLETPIRLSALQNALMAAYEIDTDTCRTETLPFLNRIAGLGLLIVSEAQTT